MKKIINKKFEVVRFNGSVDDFEKLFYNIIDKWRLNDKDLEVKDYQKKLYIVKNNRTIDFGDYNKNLYCSVFYWYCNHWTREELFENEKNLFKSLVNISI